MNWRKYLFRLVVLPIARLPERARYRVSDGLALVLRRVVKYRRAVIDHNLAIAFPEKPPAERARIRDQFYAHFVDVALEQTWLFTATPEELLARTPMTNPEVLAQLGRQGRPVMIAAGHHNNYEMGAASLALQMNMPVAAIYAPLVNPYFDERVRETRGRFGLQLWSRREVRRRAEAYIARGGAYAIGFAIDQSPRGGARKWWVPFFGRPTATAIGIEHFARELGAAVAYISMRRLRRGYYDYTVELVTGDATDAKPGSIVAEVTRRLEEVIRRDPVGWLWSHRRWKLSPERDRLPTDGIYPGDEFAAWRNLS